MLNLKVSGIIAIAAFFLSLLIGIISGTAMPLLLVRAIVFAVLFFIMVSLIYVLVSRFLPELLAAESTTHTDIDFLQGSRVDIMEGDSENSAGNASPSVPVFMGAQADDSEEGLGNISDLAKKTPAPQASGSAPAASALGGGNQSIGLAGMDQNVQDGYNEEGELEELAESDQFTPWEPPRISTGASPRPSASAGTVAPAENQAFAGTAVPGGAAAYAKPRQPIPDSADSDSDDFFPDLDSMAGAFIPTPTSEGSETSEYPGSSSRRSRSNKDSGWSGDFHAKDMAAGLRTVLNKEKEG